MNYATEQYNTELWHASAIVTIVYSLGVALYLEGVGLIQNNSIVQVTANTRLQCLSASTTPDIGHILAPNGTDITSDPAITRGGLTDPGFVLAQIESGSGFDQGVYRCVIPDENGVQQILHAGIYQGRFNSTLNFKTHHTDRFLTRVL